MCFELFLFSLEFNFLICFCICVILYFYISHFVYQLFNLLFCILYFWTLEFELAIFEFGFSDFQLALKSNIITKCAQ